MEEIEKNNILRETWKQFTNPLGVKMIGVRLIKWDILAIGFRSRDGTIKIKIGSIEHRF